MKTILVLTDFTARAENATWFSLKFSSLIKANILLYNAFGIPQKNSLATQVEWPVNADDMEKESMDKLRMMALKMEKVIELDNEDTFKPEISCRNGFGSLTDLVKAVVINHSIGLSIMSSRKSSDFKRLVFGSDTHDLLDKVLCPVMLIPETYQFTWAKKITYATDHRSTDKDVVYSLAILAKLFSADLLISHVSEKESDNEGLVEPIMKSVMEATNYQNITYKEVKGENVIQTLCEVNEMEHTDILALVHRRQHFPRNLLHTSISKQLVRYCHVPLMIYPFTYGQQSNKIMKKSNHK